MNKTFVLTCLTASLVCLCAGATEGNRPNILWVITDDLRIDPKEQANVAYQPRYAELATFLRNKLGNIVLGDGRVECDWTQKNKFNISNFAPGAHDRTLNIPEAIIPKP